MRARRSEQGTSVFEFSSTRALFDKATRERDRFDAARSVSEKADHFVNFCITATATVDQYLRDLKRLERTAKRKIKGLHRVFDRNDLRLVRQIANRFKHGPKDDMLEAISVITTQANIRVDDGNIDLTHPELENHFDAEIIEIHVDQSAKIVAHCLRVRLVGGSELDARTLVHRSIELMDSVFSVVYLPDEADENGRSV